jgi:hypothetical protein
MQTCTNFKICGKITSSTDQCPQCVESFGAKLEYVDTELYCPICIQNVELSVKHPAGCGHTVCVGCFTEIWYPASIPDVIPEDYGMPHCKNCTDDDDSVLCTCDADWKKWVADCPEEHSRYQTAWLVRNGDTDPFSTRADKFKCPVCRADGRTTTIE